MTDPVELGEAPDLAEPVHAWRVWRVVVRENGYRLASVLKPTVWPVGSALQAGCLAPPPPIAWLRRGHSKRCHAPGASCECGIYGASLRGIQPYVRDPPREPAVGRVLGQVALWGRVIECERGFRASHAYPHRIFVTLDSALRSGEQADELALRLRHYEVPVQLVPSPWATALDMLQRREPSLLP